jgi:hypothetical protein
MDDKTPISGELATLLPAISQTMQFAVQALRQSGVPGLKCASGEERHWTRRAYGTREEVPA